MGIAVHNSLLHYQHRIKQNSRLLYDLNMKTYIYVVDYLHRLIYGSDISKHIEGFSRQRSMVKGIMIRMFDLWLRRKYHLGNLIRI